MNLTTPARVRLLLEAGGSNQGSLDPVLAELIPAVSAAMERELDRHVLRVARTVDLDVDAGQRVFRLRGIPVASIASVSFDPDRAFGSGTEIDASYYAANLETGRLTIDRYALTPGDGVLRVVYTGGMVEQGGDFGSEYPELAHLAALQVAYLLQRKDSLAATSQGMAGGTVGFSGPYSWLPIVREGLNRARRW